MANWKEGKLEEVCSVEWGNSELTKASYILDGEYLAVSAAGCDGRIGHREHAKNTPVISAIGANCGRMFLPREDFTAIKNTITITPVEGVSDGRYLYEVLTFTELPKRGGAQPFMSKGDIESFKIYLPPLAEQRKIAEILRTWDEAIETAEAELKAKQERKRWIVSQLLGGQESGRTYRLGDLFERVVRRNTSGCTMSLTISASAGLIDQREVFSRKITSAENDNYFLVKRGEYAYNRSHSIGNPYGVVRRLVRYQEGIVSPIYLVFKCISQDVDERYADILFEGGGLNRQLRKIAQEGARAHGLLNVTAEDFFSMKVSLPDLARQNRDAEMLSRVGLEIDLKEKHVESLRAQKRGLMQKLLTGAIRVSA